MRILFSHRIRSRDGQTVHIESLVAAFRSQGHEVLVVGPPTYDRTDFGGEGRRFAVFRRLCPATVYELIELAYNIPSIWRLVRAYRKFRPDFVYERYNLFFFGGLALKRCLGARFYLEINAPLAEERATHGGLSLKRLALFLQRYVWRQADRVYPVTEVLADQVARAGVCREAITVNQNGVDLTRYPAPRRCPPSEDSAITLGFIGFLRSWHGIEAVISLLGSTGDHLNLRLLIGGEGPARRDLEQQVKQLGLADKVQFLGLVPRDRLAEVIGTFDIALQPRALSYASPLKLFEYMVLGRAIVAPEQPNICEVLTDGRNALLFKPDNPVSLRRAIALLAANPHLRDQLGARARLDLLDNDYTWAGNARRITDTHLIGLATHRSARIVRSAETKAASN